MIRIPPVVNNVVRTLSSIAKSRKAVRNAYAVCPRVQNVTYTFAIQSSGVDMIYEMGDYDKTC